MSGESRDAEEKELTHAGISPEPPALDEAKKLLARSRFMGRVSTVIFLLAVLAVFDGLQTLMRHEFNNIAVVPGEEVLVSGMLPGGVTSHEGVMVRIEGDADISFVPFETYKGFWMGGHMWRARLTVPLNAAEGVSLIVVEDILPEEDKDKTSYAGLQNPALVFAVTVYPSELARREADNSLIRRYTGFPAFGLAAAAVFLALMAGLANWKLFGSAEKALAAHGVFFIHGVKELRAKNPRAGPWSAEEGYKGAVAQAGRNFSRDEHVTLMNRDWRVLGQGKVKEVTHIKAFALFPATGERPQYGWLVARASRV